MLLHVNKGIKRKYSETDIFNQEVKVSILRKVDSIFNKGINYYLDPKALKFSKEESIFFRKDSFNAELSLGAKQIVNHYEEEKIALSALSKLSNLGMERKLPFYTVRNSARTMRLAGRQRRGPEFLPELRGSLGGSNGAA